jgi:hypothetical protein
VQNAFASATRSVRASAIAAATCFCACGLANCAAVGKPACADALTTAAIIDDVMNDERMIDIIIAPITSSDHRSCVHRCI